MKKFIHMVVALSFFFGVFAVGTEGASAADLPFKDIANHWAKDNILKAYESGLVDGYPDGTFRPDSVVSADQFVSMMLRAFSDGGSNFDQEWLNSLISYQPAFLAAIYSAVNETGFNFQNAKSGYWAKPYIDMLYKMEFLLPFDSVFPQGYEVFKKQITREKASYLLGNWYTLYENDFDFAYKDYVITKSGFVDMNKFSNGAASSHKSTVLLAGLMEGYADKHFYPQRYVTRAQALTMIQRLRDPSLRKPFKPDLTGQHYIELDGEIYLYSDQFKLDTYKKIVELANKHVTKGYIAVGNLGIAVFDSKDTYDKRDFQIRFGQWDNLPTPEFTFAIADGDARSIDISYNFDKLFPNSSELVSASFELLAGNGKGPELKTKSLAVEKTIKDRAVEFTFNNRKYRMFKEGTMVSLEYYY